MESVVQHTINVFSLGSLYAVIALGVALVFSVMRLVNFAHGATIMVGAYVVWALSSSPWPVWAAGAVLATAVAAVLMERVAFRPLRNADMTSLLVSSLGVSMVMTNLALLFFGGLPKSVTMPSIVTESISLGSIDISILNILTLVIAAATLVVLAAFFRYTRTGIHMRAAAEDTMMARLLGVRVNRLIALSFAISGLLAGIAGILLAAQLGAVTPSFGFYPVVIGFVAAVIGGMGSLSGAALGGFALGAGTTLLQIALPASMTSFREAFLYAGVALLLLLRPQGLLGRRDKWERI